MRPLSKPLVLGTAAVAGLTGALLAAPSQAADKLAFSHTVLIDPQRLGSEPIIKADPSGGLYGSSIIGFSNSVSFLWKSQDHGAQWDLVHALPNAVPAQRPTGTHGGGDSEIVIGPKVAGKPGYTVSFYDLESLADIGVATSFDSGKTFDAQTTNALAGDTAGTDRQWGQLWRDAQGKDHLFLLYNALASGDNGKATILRESLDYGKTWTNLGDGGTLNGVYNAGALGQLRVDKAGNLFFTSENSPAVNLVRGMRQKNGTYTFSATEVSNESGTNTRQLFITSALDTAGNIYVAWARDEAGAKDTSVGTYVAASTDHGKTFGRAVKVNTKDIHNANFPWITAGDPGRIAVAFYGTKNKLDSTSNPGPWDVYLTQSIDMLSKHPHMTQVKVSEHPSHTNPICLSGLGCTAGSGQDRNLGDFFQVDMDPTDGAAIVLWADTANQYGALAGSAVNAFARQTGGPSLLKGKKVNPRPELTQKTNHATDAAGDARRFAEGTSNPAMDLREVKVQDAGSNIVITAKLNKLDQVAMLNPANGPAASVVVSWWAGKHNAAPDNTDLGTVRFVGMQTQGAAPVFFGGSPTYTNTSSATSRFAEFVPGPQAPPVTGSIDGNVVTWTISKAAAGLGGDFAPKKLFSVTGTTLQGMPAYTYNAAAEQVDATPPFTFTAK
ncbi:MAG: hypothetical protein QOE05_2060 [Actinomycetota bacterium]|nr:hypothetical protein [Actinomycetota bacterium]